MYLKTIAFKDYRNLVDARVQLGSGINVFYGDNGQGKTNFLETIYLLSNGRSFRTSKNSHLISQGKTQSILSAELEKNGLDYKIAMQLEEKSKSIFINSKKSKVHQLMSLLNIVLFSPESLGAIKNGPDERRQLVDDLALSLFPEQAHIFDEYEKAYRSKARLLKDLQILNFSKDKAIAVLESLNPVYIQKSIDLTFLRLEALRALLTTFQSTARSLFNKNDVDISVEYVISGEKAQNWSLTQVTNALQNRLRELGPREIESGSILVGPHKHEISILYNGNDSRFFCSQGQQRALVLSFKISQALSYEKRHGTAPILLLDDVLSELDIERRNYLIEFLRKNKTQTIVTTTDISFGEELRGENLTEFQVIGGQIRQAR